MHNPSFSFSVAGAAAGDWQGGVAGIAGMARPVLWQSSSAQWINLIQSPGDNGFVFGMQNGYQVGQLNSHASLWSGTPESRVDLHPSWAALSEARGVWGNQQVGWAGTAVEHAALWQGTAASYVDLHPAGAVRSRANAIASGQQGGFIDVPFPGGGTVQHAALWSGTAGSFVDLNPPGALGSGINAMWPGQQAGALTWIAGGTHAGYWSGTPESFVDLHPAGAGMSEARGTVGTAQVGYATFTTASAVIWFGTPESVVNLHDFLPPGQYFQSVAHAVTFHNGLYYVAGTASTTIGHIGEAWLWVGIPAPSSAVVPLAVLALASRRRGPAPCKAG